MFDLNTPVVLFPNYLAKTSLILLDLLGHAAAKNVLPSKHDALRPYIRELQPQEGSAENLTQVYENLKGVILGELEAIPGVRTKFIVEDVACILIKRATGCARRICALASTGSKTDIDTSRDWAYFAEDLQVVHAILSSGSCFIPDMILRGYLVALENVQAAIGHNIPADLMCNKIRRIIKGGTRPNTTASRPNTEQTPPAAAVEVLPEIKAAG